MSTRNRHNCVIPCCTGALRKEVENLALYRFPTSKFRLHVRTQWIEIVRDLIGDVEWEPKDDSFICSRHFEAKEIIFTGSRRNLLTTAVPSQFLTENTVLPDPSSCLSPSVSTLEPTENDVEAFHEIELETSIEDSDMTKGNAVYVNENQSGSENEDNLTKEDAPDIYLDNLESSKPLPIKVTCPACAFLFPVKFDSHDINVTVDLESAPSTPKRRKTVKSRKRLFSEISSLPETSTGIATSISSKPSPLRNAKPVTPKSRLILKNEHSYCKSPGRAVGQLGGLKASLEMWKKKAKLLQDKLDRREKAKTSLKEQLTQIKALSKNQMSDLETQFPGLLQTMVENEKNALCVKGKSGITYNDEMKKFAATVHFYSPRAYSFLRDHLSLPHPNTISSWMKSSDCGPGFNMDVLKRLSEARRQDKNNVMTDVVMMIDEMAIHKDLIWNASKHCYVGHIDYGTSDSEMDCDAPLAGNALVLLIAGLSGGWKCPLGYIFTDKVDSDIQRTFVDKAFFILEQEEFIVHSLTCDGNTANVAMFEAYGVKECPGKANGEIDFDLISTSFPNPANENKKVYAIYDVVHMIKLWRNLLAQCGEVTTGDGKKINWKYIEDVHKLQNIEKIRAGNKLGLYHIEFQNHKMNVKLAVQALSKSVADSIVFCREDLKLPGFEDSEATSTFIYKLDKVVDILNSRNAGQKGQKAPLNRRNLFLHIHILEEFCKEVLKMKYTEVRTYKKTGREVLKEKLLVQSMRKRAVIGCVVSIKSIIDISKDLLLRSEAPFKYVMTYRFSQDLIELFFNKIRGRLGRNNNPNVLEFQHTMKRIWHQNLLKSSNTGNCIEQMEEGSIPGGLLPLKPCHKIVRLEDDEIQDLDLHGFTQGKNSEFYTNCLAYIAGNVVRVVGTKMKCEICAEGLLDNPLDELDSSIKLLIQRKDRGGLFTPCKSVFKVVELSDSIFRTLVAESLGRMNIKNLDTKIVRAVMEKFVGSELFPHIQNHFIDFDPFESESHVCLIIKNIVSHFLRIRLFDYGKRYQKFQKISTRHTLNKLTLFAHQ